MAEELDSGVGELFFSLIVSYFGAMELFYVVRHLIHWSFRHPKSGCDDNTMSLQLLQENLRDQQAAAEALEAATGANTMQDGVAYQDGFRIEQADLPSKADRCQESEVEAETPLAAESNKTEEEKQPAGLDIEQKRKLADEEHEKEEQENTRKLVENRDSEIKEQKENEEKLVESERQLEQAQRLRELAEQDNDGWNSQIPKVENQYKDFHESPLETTTTTGITEKLLEIERLRTTEDLLDDDEEEMNANSRRLLANEREQEEKQRRIEENARLFLEAEDKLVELQQHMEATENDTNKVDVSERIPSPRFFTTESLSPNKSSLKNVKTQISQSKNIEQSHTVLSKSLVFPDLSDEGSSVEPMSSQKSSFSTQPSEEITAGVEDNVKTLLENDRQDPEGEDNVSNMRYSEEYLRSLDGIKSHQLSGEDGSGRRRAFKKRRSNSSSNSSRESRTSRDEEAKILTTLEVEDPPTAKVKNRRSPLKDTMPMEADSLRSALQMLDEENLNSSGELVPEHYKNTEHQSRQGEMSFERTEKKEAILEAEASNLSSPEKVICEENKEAVTVIHRLEDTDTTGTGKHPTNDENNSNLQAAEFSGGVNNARASSSPRLRRSPRIDEMDQYEEHWRGKEAEVQKSPDVSVINTPTISIQSPDVAPWRDQYGLLMEGLSDFYDFTASVNPSRSRSTSRQPSPETSLPKNVNNTIDINKETSIEILDDTGDLVGEEISKQNIIDLIESTFDMPTTNNLNGEHNVKGLLQNVADEPSTSRECLPMIHIVNEDMDQNLILPSLQQESQRERLGLQSDLPLPNTENFEQNLVATKTNIDQNDDFLIKVEKSDESIDEFLTSVPVDEISNLLEDTQVNSKKILTNDIKVISEENTKLFVESLRAEQRTRSRSRSRSPLPTSDNIERSLESRRLKRIQLNDELFEKLAEKTPSPNGTPPLPTISIKCTEEEPAMEKDIDEDNSTESITKLVAQLRIERSMSRSRSRTPALNVVNQGLREYSSGYNLLARSKTPERCEEVDVGSDDIAAMQRNCRSLSPSRSRSTSSSRDFFIDGANDNDNFNNMSNMDSSESKGESENFGELESVFAAEQHVLDLKALHQLNNACEEVELRVLSPTEIKRKIEMQQNQEDLRNMPSSQTTSDYEWTISEEYQDEKEKLASDLKYSTSANESIDMGSLRRKAAVFRRSLSPSRSVELPNLTTAKMYAAKRQELQAAILESLTSASQKVTEEQIVENKLGAKPKIFEYDRNFSAEVQDLGKEIDSSGFKRSAYSGTSTTQTSLDIEDMRQRTSEFLRSRSQSRSPLADEQIETLKSIDAVVAKRELQDQLLDQFTNSTINFQNFSRHLNTDFLDNERRASDSALMYKPEHVMEYSENDSDLDLDPEEYHHFRRFSLAQEQPVEEYPSDDYVCISQIAVRTLTGTRTWLKEDFYCDDFNDSNVDLSSSFEENICKENIQIDYEKIEAVDNQSEIDTLDVQSTENSNVGVGEVDYFADYFDLEQLDEISSNDSDDDKRTVVEIEDEFDEGISDYNERGGPTDESHHDTSECEEAEREADRYANRDANDWNDIENVDEFLDFGIEEGAVGGMSTPYSDPDLLIEQIYNDAVKNRKQSGILRDYESILQENEESSSEYIESDLENVTDGNNMSGLDESGSHPTPSSSNNERNPSISTRHSTRLRARYGYNPQLQGTFTDQDIEIDLNYKPKREYNWRKNFKLDDETLTDNTNYVQKEETTSDVDEYLLDYDDLKTDYMEMRHCSLGGESITLFSQSPQREPLSKVDEDQPIQQEMQPEDPTPSPLKVISEPSTTTEKLKKRKSKKKTRKSTRIESDIKDEEDSENQMNSRRSSSLQMETDSPRRKSRSRRSSKSSLANEESVGLFSPRNSVAFVDPIVDIAEEFTEATETVKKKKTSKRKKATEETPRTAEIKKEQHVNGMTGTTLIDVPIVSVSPSLTIESFQNNLLATVSAAESVCVTPASISSSLSEIITRETSPTTISTAVPNPSTSSGSVVDTFDILKDANFYPLF